MMALGAGVREGRANDINKNIGWHTFRESFGTLLKANGEDVKALPGALTACQ
jgi:site-specific recombinase XerD